MLRHLLICAAALLTIAGSLSVYYGADDPRASFIAEAVDGEADELQDVGVCLSQQIDEPAFLTLTISHQASFVDVPMASGLQTVRGPPVV